MNIKEIINDDCFKYLGTMRDESVDLILTDPPYGIEYFDNVAFTSQIEHGIDPKVEEIKNDKEGDIDWDRLLHECYRILKPKKMLYVCCRTDMLLNIAHNIKTSEFEYAHDFVWHKGDMGYGNLAVMGTTHEMVLALSKGKPEKSRVIRINKVIERKIKDVVVRNRVKDVTIDHVENVPRKRTLAFYGGRLSTLEYYGHPTQKPVGMLAYIIQNRTDEGDLVMDPFVGVGSTLVAAELLNRNYIGVDIDESCYQKALKRLKDSDHLDMYREMLDEGMFLKNGRMFYRKLGQKK